VDAFHLVKLANDTSTAVRQRLSQPNDGRRGRSADPSWANRRLLLRGADTLSPGRWTRLTTTFATDDPTGQLAAAWGVKEQLRRLLACTSFTDAAQEKMRLGHYVQVADMAETDQLWNTLYRWWPAIEVLLITGVTNAKTEAANTSMKTSKAPHADSAPNTTTQPVSSSPVPPKAQHEHQPPRTHIHAEPRRATLVNLHISGSSQMRV